MWTVLLVAPFGSFGKANSASTSFGLSGLSISEAQPSSKAACVKGWVMREQNNLYEDKNVIGELTRVGLPEGKKQIIRSLVGSAFGEMPHLKNSQLYRSFKVSELHRCRPLTILLRADPVLVVLSHVTGPPVWQQAAGHDGAAVGLRAGRAAARAAADNDDDDLEDEEARQQGGRARGAGGGTRGEGMVLECALTP